MGVRWSDGAFLIYNSASIEEVLKELRGNSFAEIR